MFVFLQQSVGYAERRGATFADMIDSFSSSSTRQLASRSRQPVHPSRVADARTAATTQAPWRSPTTALQPARADDGPSAASHMDRCASRHWRVMSAAPGRGSALAAASAALRSPPTTVAAARGPDRADDSK